ncbi:hypothetical protein [Chitinophaga sp. CF418]|uniref:hypothetical protein n=1 Tax=Chitinophaga sp. CF418 TaxID=1855287 RepID=UPI000916F95F|nr:hypothetical protein [Chitinophaga sp. CF418]SHM69880.1 hypothetical protein SAMN05216311_1036 [Chitinophaga sp. CF418]
MNNQPNFSIAPEAILADKFLMCIPRAKSVTETDLKLIINNQSDKDLFDNYQSIALKILIDEGYVTEARGVGISNSSSKYSLTQKGRELKDAGGYVLSLKRKNEKDTHSNKVTKAEGKKKIFDNKVKIFLLLLAAITPIIGVLSFWKNSTSKSDTPAPTQGSSANDTTPKNNRQIGISTELPEVIPSKNNSTLTQVEKSAAKPIVPSNETKPLPENQTNSSTTNISIAKQPIQITTSDNIEFKLTKAEGNSKAQTIKLTILLTTSAANWYIMSAVRSIIDPEGNEYTLKSFTNGASNYSRSIDLNTGVPIKCTYTFGGVLPDVKRIKLFSYSYTHSWGEPFAVEFRDIPVDWD